MPDIRSVAQDVKERVSALEMGRRMGLSPDRHGYCVCPFHTEKTGSLRLYDGEKGWWCYGCHTGGSVIDLVMKYYGISLSQALVRIDAEMGMGLRLGDDLPPQEREKIRQAAENRRREHEKEKAAYSAALDALLDAQVALCKIDRRIEELCPRGANDPISPELPALYRKRQETQETINRLEMEVIRV